MQNWKGFRTYGDAKLYTAKHGGIVAFANNLPQYANQNRLYRDIIANEGTDTNLFPYIVYGYKSEGSHTVDHIEIKKIDNEYYIFAISEDGEIVNYVYGLSALSQDLHEYVEYAYWSSK